MIVGFYVLMFVLGAVFGSFLCCQARRLNLRISGHKSLGARSVCMHCKKMLKWYENIPVVSWLVQRGKCTKCGTKIGCAEILSELGVGFSFLLFSTSFDPFIATGLKWAIFVATLVLILTLSFLAVYDGIYGQLPTLCLIFSIIYAIMLLFLHLWASLSVSAFTPEIILKPLGSALILGGLYLILYLVSKGKWVGDGDWLLGLAIGIALGSPWLALVALFLSNAIACVVMLPFAKKSKNHRIHFGPFLVIAYVITVSFSGLLESMVL